MPHTEQPPRTSIAPSSTDLLPQIEQAITIHRLLRSGDRVVVGVSGGTDSVVLLHLLTRLRSRRKLTLRIAHLDHGLRDQSGDDADFVRQLGAQWDIPVTATRVDVQPLCARNGWSLEDGARRVRYQVFLDVARRYSASRVALAHTADDQAETVLMRVMRGTGLTGLGAMAMTRTLEEIDVIRPLLGVWRCDILSYRRAFHVPYREDATNTDTQFLRNRVRHELLPLLERVYNPKIKHVLVNLAEQSRWDYESLQAAAKRQWKRIAKVKASRATSVKRNGTRRPTCDQVTIATTGFLRQHKAIQRQLVRQAIEAVRGQVGQFEFRHWLEVERLFLDRPVGTQLDLPGGVRWRREAGQVVCRSVGSSDAAQPVPGPGQERGPVVVTLAPSLSDGVY